MKLVKLVKLVKLINGLLFRHPVTSPKGSKPSVFLHFWLRNVLSRHNSVHFFDTFSTSQHSKSGHDDRQFLTLLTWKCASRHNGVHFFDIVNFQKWSEAEVFCTFWLRNVLRTTIGVHFFDIATSKSRPTLRCFVHIWLGNVLRATTMCTFSTSQLPKVVRR